MNNHSNRPDLPTDEALRRAKLAAEALKTSGRAQKIGCPPIVVGGLRDALDFTIESHGGINVLSWKSGGCRLASEAEMAMWEALAQSSSTAEPSYLAKVRATLARHDISQAGRLAIIETFTEQASSTVLSEEVVERLRRFAVNDEHWQLVWANSADMKIDIRAAINALLEGR